MMELESVVNVPADIVFSSDPAFNYYSVMPPIAEFRTEATS